MIINNADVIYYNGAEVDAIIVAGIEVYTSNPFGGASFTDSPTLVSLGTFTNAPSGYYNYGGF